MDAQTKARIDELVTTKKVVLFMKGSRHFPQCGFSSQVVNILDKLIPKYDTVNILSDAGLRDSMKEYSEWPTFPQLYIDGKFVGGCDIVKEMFSAGELQMLLGAEEIAVKAPKITLTESAAKAFTDAAKDAGDDVLRFEANESFQYDLYFGAKQKDDLASQSRGLAIHTDKATASRVDGTTIDYLEGKGGGGFKIDNPNEPPRVKSLTPVDLKALLDKGEKIELFDVRTEDERKQAKLESARLLDMAAQDYILALPKDTKIVFHCHHGGRSRNAAEHFLKQGFRNLYNLEGGIDAWSLTVDTSIPRY